ncbi:MAG: trehalose-6-phosphate synthase [Gammaproteobacteria bacterium]
MTVGIVGALKAHGGVWLGWSGQLVDSPVSQRHHHADGAVEYVMLDLPATEFQGYYAGFANQVLWPLFHGRRDLIAYNRAAYDSYLAINARFADELASILRPDDIVWAHDYHLIPLACCLRARGVRNLIGFFLHTPFADPDDLMRLPVGDSIAEFLCAYDLVGLQTPADLRAFRAFLALRPLANRPGPLRLAVPPRSNVFPIGIDMAEFETIAAAAAIDDPALAAAFERLKPDVTPIIAVDRLDYSKGIVERVCAFDAFLNLHPEFARSVSLIQVAPIGRAEIPAYRSEAARVKHAFAALEAMQYWAELPAAQLLTDGVDRQSLAAAYRRSRVAMVTPLSDGMNLVAKEYVAAQDPRDPGVLVLSRFAGAAIELDVGAVLVDPCDLEDVVQALQRALMMPLSERQQRWRRMIDIIRQNDAAHWSSRFVAALARAERAATSVPAPPRAAHQEANRVPLVRKDAAGAPLSVEYRTGHGR